MNSFIKQKESHRCRKQTYGYQEMEGRNKLREWDGHIHPTYIKQITKNLLYSIGNCIQYSGMAYMEK